ncbi:hypothetical protein [Agathobaculum sp.]|uniref:hypothetical protein n=1 Tax=Agathobaculum sp. TaxID=2048138 RepID=UPI002A820336|nr:hypothetical protein [Agathobaculum sp.]MDY3619059.1 hypothetical protein [Agathobaculum sp.]
MPTIRNDITKVKKINIELIKSALKEHPESTKGQIAETTGISVVTCGKILNELQAKGEVLEVQQINTGCGRPATSYRFNATFELVACLFLWSDRGQLELVSQISDLTGQVTFSEVRALDTLDYGTLEDAVRHLLAQDGRIRAVAVGLPGAVSRGTVTSSYLLALNGVPLEKKLRNAFPAVTVILESAARAAAYGYCIAEQPRPDEIISYFFIPTAVRTGRGPHEILGPDTSMDGINAVCKPLIVDVGFAGDRKIIRGSTGFAGSMGMFLPPGAYSDLPATVISELLRIMIPVINPSVIVVTGNGVTRIKLAEIEDLCARAIPTEHRPRFLFRPDCHLDYSRGLTLIALQELSCPIELVQKRI